MDATSAVEMEDAALEGQVASTLEQLKTNNVIAQALERLQKELPENLRYHAFPHTPDVMHDAIMFALKDGKTDPRFLLILGIAAAYHDIGYIEQYRGNEPIGARAASKAMRGASFTEDQIRLVSEAIEDTAVDFTPEKGLSQRQARSDLGRYLLDGDVSNFGRKDGREKTNLIYQEMVAQGGNVMPEKDFLKGTLRMMENHSWQTDAARSMRQAQKDANIANLRQEIAMPLAA